MCKYEYEFCIMFVCELFPLLYIINYMLYVLIICCSLNNAYMLSVTISIDHEYIHSNINAQTLEFHRNC